MKYLSLLITVPITAFSVLFAISNTAETTVNLSIIDRTFKMPLCLLGLGLMGAGFFLGALFVWMHSQKTTFKYWKEVRKSEKLEKEIKTLRAQNQPSLPAS
jgi:uncharacterized integral membrane protein